MENAFFKRIAETCTAIKRYGFGLDRKAKLITTNNSCFEAICKDMFLQIAPKEECLWRPEDIRLMHEHARGLPLLFFRDLSHFMAYSNGHILVSLSLCRPRSQRQLAWIVDHERGHHRDDQLLFSFFPHLKQWKKSPPSEQKYMIMIRSCLELFRRHVHTKSDIEMNDALEDLFLLSKVFLMKPEERVQRLQRIQAHIFEVLRFGEEISDERLKTIILEEDFTRLFKMPDGTVPAQKSEFLRRNKEARSDFYLEHCLVTAALEEFDQNL